MLKKLLKYDLKSIFKVLVVFYILSALFAILTRLFFNIENSFIMDIVAKVCSGITIAMIINILINNILRLWIRFKNNFYGDESYLTHTLPVSKDTLYLSKFITSIITLLVSFIVIGISLFIAYYSKENIEFIKSILLPIADTYGSTVIKVLLAFFFIFFLQFSNTLQAGYTGIILGHRKNNIKVVYSVIIGFATYIGTQVLAIIMLFIAGLFNKNIMNLFFTNEIVNVETVKTIIIVAIIIYGVILVLEYFINLKLFKKDVNVD